MLKFFVFLCGFTALTLGLVGSPYQRELISEVTPAEKKWDFEVPTV